MLNEKMSPSFFYDFLVEKNFVQISCGSHSWKWPEVSLQKFRRSSIELSLSSGHTQKNYMYVVALYKFYALLQISPMLNTSQRGSTLL